MKRAMASKEQATAPRSSRNLAQRSSLRSARQNSRVEMHRDSRPSTESSSPTLRHAGVRSAIDSPAQPLGKELQPQMESRLGFDLSQVCIHTDASAAHSASRLHAAAYTSGSHIVFAEGKFNPSSDSGRTLLEHELAHVIQQGLPRAQSSSLGTLDRADSPSESVADRTSVSPSPKPLPVGQVNPGTIQRKMSMRDVGKGEQSGFARVPELITRLNDMSSGLAFALTGSELTYSVKEGGTLSNFDTQMQGFIDQAAVIPLRFTNQHGLTGNRTEGFNDRVQVDDYRSGYVDIDDLLGSNDLGLQSALVHFLRERSSTANYVHRIGTDSLKGGDDSDDARAHQAEFDHSHARGIQAEAEVLRDFFSDPTIRLVSGEDHGDIFRIFRNRRGDTIRTRVRQGHGANAGVDAISVEVVTRDGKIHTPEEYKALLAAAASSPASTTSAANPGSGGKP